MKWLVLALGVSACSAASSGSPDSPRSVYWSDGDSGRIAGMDFRLADVDAPETGGVGAAIGGAECERERDLGFEAKAFMVDLTKGSELEITHREAPDRYGRTVIGLSANGQDVARAGLAAGVLKPWPHEGDRAMSDKPDWCG
ncbi:thermonuclease family protein [Henriciella aquimarina]|uniref:thermonuclease family protein n=1 Tax=Henriciella aquimarina TaxID=545261 RepID=UPI0009FEAAA3|nr:thermonuclease family protein [Henriciella aquimarina]